MYEIARLLRWGKLTMMSVESNLKTWGRVITCPLRNQNWTF